MPSITRAMDVAAQPAQPIAPAKFTYARRKPEESLLYKLVQRHWPGIERDLREASDGAPVPKFIAKAVEAYSRCGLLRYGFCRVYCDSCKKDQLVAWSCKARGICPSCDGRRMTELSAHLADSVFPAVPVRQFVLTVPFRIVGLLSWNAKLRGKVLSAFLRALQAHYRRQALAMGATDPQFAAVSVLQRWNGSLRTFPHWHVLCPDGAWHRTAGGLEFLAAPHLDADQLGELLTDAVQRIERQLAKHQSKRDPADARDELDDADPATAALVRNSLFGKDKLERSEDVAAAARKTAAADLRLESKNCASLRGFNLHANTRIHEVSRDRLEQLIRYVCRPTVAAKRLEDAGNDNVRILLKNEWKGGIKSVVMPGRELVARVLALIPLPRAAALRYHGLFAPAAHDRAEVVPAAGDLAKQRQANKEATAKKRKLERLAKTDPELAAELAAQRAANNDEANPKPPPDERAADTRQKWAACLQRAFHFDVLSCGCGGKRRVLAAVTNPVAVEKILRHVGLWDPGGADDAEIFSIRGPPGEDLYPADEDPGPGLDAIDEPPLDAVDEPGELDWAA
jgi:hypothetical protein